MVCDDIVERAAFPVNFFCSASQTSDRVEWGDCAGVYLGPQGRSRLPTVDSFSHCGIVL
jgi:hypothetical protein